MHCDVMCGLSAHALSLVSLVFGEVLFGGCASLHCLFLHFLANSICRDGTEKNGGPIYRVQNYTFRTRL